jgi:hypothetical protein
LQVYLEQLQKSRGAKGLVPFSTMVQLFQKGRHAECVQYCVSTYQSRVIEELAILVDEEKFKRREGEVVEIGENEVHGKLHESKYATYLALKSLVWICKQDFFKLHRLYQTWLKLSNHYVQDGPNTDTATKNSTEVKDEAGIFEESNVEYLFSADHGLLEEDRLSSIVYQGSPHSRPSVYFFNLFLKRLPKALAWSAYRGTSSVKALLGTGKVQKRVMDLGFEILKDMEKYKVEPNVSTWSILLMLLARNITLSSVEGEGQGESTQDEEEAAQWSRLWNMTRALGMGQSTTTDGIAITPSPLPKATALTYINLMYAFLMVPPSRGGPLVEEARKIKGWLESDNEALAHMSQYKRPMDQVLGFLEKVETRQQEPNVVPL